MGLQGYYVQNLAFDPNGPPPASMKRLPKLKLQAAIASVRQARRRRAELRSGGALFLAHSRTQWGQELGERLRGGFRTFWGRED